MDTNKFKGKTGVSTYTASVEYDNSELAPSLFSLFFSPSLYLLLLLPLPSYSLLILILIPPQGQRRPSVSRKPAVAARKGSVNKKRRRACARRKGGVGLEEE